MKKTILKYLTPLRIFWIVFLILLIGEIVIYINSKKDPGMGGLIMIAYGTLVLIGGILDLILSKLFSTKKNWVIQSVLILIFFSWLALQ